MTSIKLLARLLAFLLMVLLVACGGGGGKGGGPAVVSITVAPANQTVAAGTVASYTAVATYSDGSVADVTGDATWTSSASGVAAIGDLVGSRRRVTAVAAGTAVITAAYGGVSGSTNITVANESATGPNVMTVTVNGSLCSPATSAGYFNKPCVSVTVCTPGTTTCQTVNDILLDTASYGLRIFKQAIPNLSLPQISSGSGSLAGCMQFADGSTLWGPIQRATVQLGGEPAVEMPIQVIDASFGSRPDTCSNSDADPVAAGFTGVLGVGFFPNDCGTACVSTASIGIYYSCTSSGCTGTSVPLANQVRNPASALTQDNNGLVVQLPDVPFGGAASTVGSVIFGIGTRSNNVPDTRSLRVIPTNEVGDFTTVYNGVTFNEFNGGSFLDTGSNAYFIPNVNPSVLPPCSGPNSQWYCPPVTKALFATTIGAGGSPAVEVPFYVGNFVDLFGSSNSVFKEVAGTSTFGFDWGLPFFLGRKVYYGYQGETAPGLGTGPYVAY